MEKRINWFERSLQIYFGVGVGAWCIGTLFKLKILSAVGSSLPGLAVIAFVVTMFCLPLLYWFARRRKRDADKRSEM